VKEEVKMNRAFTGKAILKTNGENALHVCAEFGKVELFRWFKFEYSMDVTWENDGGETPFLIAAREGKLNIIKMMLEEYKDEFEPKKQSKDGWTAIMYASMNGYGVLTEYLIEETNIDVNKMDRVHRNALHYAARFNNCKMIDILVQAKINLNQTDRDMMLPIDIARHYHNYEAESLLMKYTLNNKLATQLRA
jgi:ankyrin repeat protein